MKKRAFLLSALLSASMAVTSAPSVWAEDLTSGTSYEDVLVSGTEENDAAVPTIIPVPTEVPEDRIPDMIIQNPGSLSYDKVYYDKDEKTGVLYGITIESCEKADDKEEVLCSYYWSAADITWASVSESGTKSYIQESGSYNLLGNWVWNMEVDHLGVSAAKGGYTLKIAGDQGIWDYGFTETDVKNHLYLSELSNAIEELPENFYIGVRGDLSKHSGMQTIDGEMYYLYADGTVLLNGEYTDAETNITYHFGADGKCDRIYIDQKAGWIVGTDGNYYWRQANGEVLREGGFHVLDGKTYFLNPTSGRRRTGWVTWKKNTYYLDLETGVLVTGMQEIDGQYYYFAPETGEMSVGWMTIDGKRYYFQKDGTRKKGWLTLDDKKYYFEKDGTETFGWRSISGKKYYFDPKTGAARKGWLTIGSNKYYLEKDGSQHLGWQSVGGKKYYFVEKTGIMKKGWLTLGSNKYYFEKDGAMTTGWRSLGGKRYYFAEKSGIMKKGWLTLGNDKYYFNQDGSRFSGIRSIGGKKYYFQSNGKLLTDKQCYQIDDSFYNISSAGVLTAVSKAEELAARKLNEIGWNLYAAFKYSAGLSYTEDYKADITEGENAEADALACYGFENGRGDSFVMASTFYEMAKVLGYDVYYVKGSVPLKGGNSLKQGWCEIEKDGAVYVCDPYFYYEENKGGYMFKYGQSGTWRYENYKRQNA